MERRRTFTMPSRAISPEEPTKKEFGMHQMLAAVADVVPATTRAFERDGGSGGRPHHRTRPGDRSCTPKGAPSTRGVELMII